MTRQSEDGVETKNQDILEISSDDEGIDGGDIGLNGRNWTPAEDAISMDYVQKNGEGNWKDVEKTSGLSSKVNSCQIRRVDRLRPNLKKLPFSEEEECRFYELHAKHGNKWTKIAAALPGRTPYAVKKFWNKRGNKRRGRDGKPLCPSEIVPEDSTRSGGSDMLDRDLSGNSPLNLQLEGNFRMPCPTLDRGKITLPRSLPGETSGVRSVGQNVNTPETVAEPLAVPPHQSLAGPSTSMSCFGLPLSDVVPGSHSVGNFGNCLSSEPLSEAPKMELPSLQHPDACVGDWTTPLSLSPIASGAHPQSLVQSPPSYPCQPDGPPPSDGPDLLEDIVHKEKFIPNLEKGPQMADVYSGIVQTMDVNQSPCFPQGGSASSAPNATEEHRPFDIDLDEVERFLTENEDWLRSLFEDEEPNDKDNSRADG